MTKKLLEGLETGDLARLVDNTITIDEFKSKLGKDEDVCVLTFTVGGGKDPALDLVSFIEKGYDWVIDADTSAGEDDAGNYLVFVEFDRTDDIPNQVCELIEDLTWLTESEFDTWQFTYHQNKKSYPIVKDNLKEIVPLNAVAYNKEYGKEIIDSLKAAAGVEVTTKAPTNNHTESIRVAAGLK